VAQGHLSTIKETVSTITDTKQQTHMTINITDIKYDLYDPETNPNDDILPEDLDLPLNIKVEQKTLDELYEGQFDASRDTADLIVCRTGFEAKDFKYTIEN